MVKYYSIVFDTTAGTKRSLQVRNPNTELPTMELSAAIAQILMNDVFDPAKGSIESFNRLDLNINERIQVL